jgi:hypothetical protein
MCSMNHNVLYPARARSNVRPDYLRLVIVPGTGFSLALGSLCGGGPAEEGGTMIGIGSLPRRRGRCRFGFVPKRPSRQTSGVTHDRLAPNPSLASSRQVDGSCRRL